MSSQVLVVAAPGRFDVTPLESFRVQRLATVGQALDTLKQSPPRVVVFGSDLADGEGYTLIAHLEQRALPIPVLVEASLSETLAPVGPESRFLHWMPPGESSDGWFSQVLRALDQAEGAAPGPRYSVYDLLRLAVGLGHSTALAVTTPSGEIRLEVLGGDLWNADCGHRSGVEALAEFLFEAPLAVDAVPLTSVPSQRSLRAAGAETLRRALRLAAEPRGGPSPTPPAASGVAAPLGPALEPSPEPAGAPPVDPYERAVAGGIAAALARDFSRAVECFERALALRPGDSRAHYNLVRVRERLADPMVTR